MTETFTEHDGDDVHDEKEKGNKEKSENNGDIWGIDTFTLTGEAPKFDCFV